MSAVISPFETADRAWSKKQEDDAQPNGGVGDDWLKQAQREANGQPLGNLANVGLALRSASAWRGVLAFDEMRRCVALSRPVPIIDRAIEPLSETRILQDADVSSAQEWMQGSGLKRAGRDAVHDALDLVAREHSFHPLRDWLNGLMWDKVPRIDSWLTEYLGVEHDAAGYASTIGRLFLISMVARVNKPGCKADYMLVLEGEQGALKSTACKILAGDDYFSDGLPGDVTSKDAALHLRGKWLVEMAEMHTLSRSETTALKAFLTRATDIYRPPYARLEVYDKRQTVFVGTTNADNYLKDETGGRRFWPVKVGAIQLDRLTRDRDQLLAEAVAAYRADAPWWPDPAFERQHIAPQQAARHLADEWLEPISNFLVHEREVIIAQVARNALNIQTDRLDRATQIRIAAVLRSLKWGKGRRTGAAQWWVGPPSV